MDQYRYELTQATLIRVFRLGKLRRAGPGYAYSADAQGCGGQAGLKILVFRLRLPVLHSSKSEVESGPFRRRQRLWRTRRPKSVEALAKTDRQATTDRLAFENFLSHRVCCVTVFCNQNIKERFCGDVIMFLLRSWKESLALFVPKNFKLFLLVTIKSAVETYGFLVYYFWWLMLLVLVFDMGCYYPECVLKGTTWARIETTLKLLLLFVLFVLVRPSVPLKNYTYIKQQIRKSLLGFLVIYGFFYMIRPEIGSFVMNSFSKLLGPSTAFNLLYTLLIFIYDDAPLVILPVFVFSVLFFLDSVGSIKEFFLSVWRGIKMFFFNFPFCLLSIMIVLLIWKGLLATFGIYGQYLFFSFIPFVVSYFKNMYVKRLHDQFNLYFAV